MPGFFNRDLINLPNFLMIGIAGALALVVVHLALTQMGQSKEGR